MTKKKLDQKLKARESKCGIESDKKNSCRNWDTKNIIFVNLLGRSPRRAVNGCHRPRDFSVLTWIARSFEAATIFMALVIFWIFLTLFIRLRTADMHHHDEICIFPKKTRSTKTKKDNFTNLSRDRTNSQENLLPVSNWHVFIHL